MRVLILKVGSTVEPLQRRRGDFEDWFRSGLGLTPREAPVVAPHLGDPLPEPRGLPAVVVTGSSSMVTDAAPWSVASERWLARLVEHGVPLLGVCYGHQLLARALGGRVADTPSGREIGTVSVELTAAGGEEALFAGLPGQLVVQTTHQQSVVELPPGARHLARNAHDPFQAFAVGERAFGLQFHPEFDADVVRGYLDARATALRAEGLDPQCLRTRTRDSEHGRRILQSFLALV